MYNLQMNNVNSFLVSQCLLYNFALVIIAVSALILIENLRFQWHLSNLAIFGSIEHIDQILCPVFDQILLIKVEIQAR